MIWYSLGVARSPDCDLMEGGAELAWLGAGEWVGLRAGLIPSQWGDPGLYLLLLAFSFAYVDASGSNPVCRIGSALWCPPVGCLPYKWLF